MMDQAEISALRHKAHTLSTPAEVSQFLSDCEKRLNGKELITEVYAELRFFAFAALRRMTENCFADARTIFLTELLPWCLTTYRESTKADINVYRCRDLLGKWINELSSLDYQSVLQLVMDALISHLSGRTFKTACWTLGDVGYRDQRLVDLLMGIVLRNPGKAGDHALGLLLDLGILPAQRENCIDEAICRFEKRQHNVTCYSLVMSASRRVLEFIRDRLDSPDSEDTGKCSELLGVIAGVGERLPDNAEAADLALSLVRRIYSLDQNNVASRLALGSNLLPAIDSYLVGETFADLFIDMGPDVAQHAHAVYVQTLRMRECVGPMQLAGLPSCASTHLVDILKAVVFTEGENTGPNGSLLYDAKRGALWTALAIESGDSLGWLCDALAHEPNAFIQHELMQTYACFRAQTLPDQIRWWIIDNFDAKKEGNADIWITRTSALRVARSAATREAFDVLSKPGFTLGGTVLLDTVQALADVALVLTHDESQRESIAHALLEGVQSLEHGPRYSASVHAMLALARNHRLPTVVYDDLLEVAFRSGQRDYDQARLLEALVHSSVPIPESGINLLAQWAKEREDRVGEMAMESLIRMCKLELTEVIACRLGLKRVDKAMRWSPASGNMTKWAPFYIGLLYERSPAEFGDSMLDILEAADWQQCAQIYDVMQRTAQVPSHAPSAQIREAVIQRLISRVSPNHAELGLFSLVPCVAPEEFLNHTWAPTLEQWFADARIAFAEGIRSCIQQDVSTQARNNGTQYLIRLSEDSQYGVRRSAFRALAELDAAALCMLASTWMRSDRHEVRIWAAEAAGWIESHRPATEAWSEVLSQIEFDRHKKVRSTFKYAMRTQRQRRWVRDYLDRVERLTSPSNAEMLTIWRYGWALSRLADDDVIQRLQAIQADATRAPNVRHFIGLILKNAEKQWDDCRKKWPDPIFPLRGTSVEAGSGSISVGNGKWAVEYILWGEPATGPNAYGQWGGSCRTTNPISGHEMLGKDGTIHTEDGRIGAGFVKQWSDLTELVFCGSGEYPR